MDTIPSPSLDLIARERATYWPGNRDASGHGTFLLPGETEIDTATMRRRIALFYQQTRGRPLIRDRALAHRTLENLKRTLAETPAHSSTAHLDGTPIPPSRPL
jgi:hypothetical protein